MRTTWTYDQSTEIELMKVVYGRVIDMQFNQENILYARCKKKNNFVGLQLEEVVIQSIGGGVSAGSLPTASRNQHSKAILRRKKLYARTEVDRETMKVAKGSLGAFKDVTKHAVEMTVRGFNRNLERQMTRGGVDGDGILIPGDAANSAVTGTGSEADPYIVNFDAPATYFPAHFEATEVGDIVVIGTEATELEILEVNVVVSGGYATGSLELLGTSATLAANAPIVDNIYMQKSRGNEIIGLQGVLTATTGTLYNIPVGRRWQSYQKDAAGAEISTDLLNDLIINLKRQSGKAPNLLLISFHQYVNLLNLLEDNKRYPLPTRNKELKGQFSFSALSYEGPSGTIPIMASRFMDSDKVFALNDNHISMHSAPGGLEWFDEDGTVFLRRGESDSYEARYGGYCELYVNPHFQGIITGLAVSAS